MKKLLFLSVFILSCAAQAKGTVLFDMAHTSNAEQLKTYIAQQNYSQDELTRALHIAVEKNPDVDVITVLAKAGADVNRSLLDSEVYGGDPDEGVTDGEANGPSPLSRAWENIPKMKILLQAGADPNEGVLEGGTLFTQYVQYSDDITEMMRLLLQLR